MEGLYYYKLNSPYDNDITKNCKLTIDEIDSNFFNLKSEDIKSINFNESDKTIYISKNNDEILTLDLSSITNGLLNYLEVNYDKLNGEIIFNVNGNETIVDGLITNENLPKDNLSKIYTDYSLKGNGRVDNALRISESEKTGMLKSVLSIIDYTENDSLPSNPKLGDRYITKEEVNDYGFLYNFNAVKKISQDIELTGWRVPSKNDWDNMLNAIEPCEFKNHDSIESNKILGKIAGKLLKSQNNWEPTIDDGNVNECNVYNMSLMPSGRAINAEPKIYYDFNLKGAYWTTTTQNDTDIYTKVFMYDQNGVMQFSESPDNYVSIRLIKDYDGNNHQESEFINGVSYGTVLIPSINTENGYSIWTNQDVSFNDAKYNPLIPNNGEGVTVRNRFCVNEWDGYKWLTRELSDGDSILVKTDDKGEKNKLYTLIDNKLFSLSDYLSFGIYDVLNKQLNESITSINEKYDIIQGIVTNLFNEFYQIIPILQENDSLINQKISQIDNTILNLNEKIDNQPILTKGEYNKENETIDLSLSDDNKITIDVGDLINELTVPENQTTPIILNIDKIKSKVDEHGDLIWQDVLTADVRISEDTHSRFNILKKDQDGRSLTVDGLASNIMYHVDNDNYISLQDALDTLEIPPSKENDNIIITKDDGLYANFDISYDNIQNILTFHKSNGKNINIQLNSVSIIEYIRYDNESESIVIGYSSNGNKLEVLIPIRDIINEWVVNSTNSIELTKEINATDGKDVLSANIKVSKNENNGILIKQDGLYVSNNAKDILIGNTNIEEEIQSIKNGIDNIIIDCGEYFGITN